MILTNYPSHSKDVSFTVTIEPCIITGMTPSHNMNTLTYQPYYSTGNVNYPGNAEQWALPTYTQAPLCNYTPTFSLTVDGVDVADSSLY